MTSSTDQDDASFPEPSLSCFKCSGPVVELAAGKKLENQIKLPNTLLLKTLCIAVVSQQGPGFDNVEFASHLKTYGV